MAKITGLTSSQQAKYLNESASVINRFDRNRDGAIDRSEAERYQGRFDSTYTTRTGDFVTATTVTNDRFELLRSNAFAKVDANLDGRLTASEMTEAYLKDRDTNRNGVLSNWEKFKMSLSGVSSMVTTSREEEVGRKSRTYYDPLPVQPSPPPVYDVPSYDRPTPPPVGRPTPPSVGRPTPPSVY